MNFSDFITHNGKRVYKEHFIHLIQVSRVDGKISATEMEMLHKEGRKFGLTDPEIDKMILSEDLPHYHAPYSLRDKFEHLFNIATLILADDEVTESEKRIIKRFSIEAGFRDDIIEDLIPMLLTGIENGDDEEMLYKEFKSRHF